MNTEHKAQTISVIGMGYIGLPTATMFASAGYKVFGYDIDNDIINTLNGGNTHFSEPDLQGLFKSVLDSGNLIPISTLQKSDVFIICVPTPFRKDEEKKLADLSYVESASRAVAGVIEKGNLVILESTVPPGTTEDLMVRIIEEESNLKVNKDFLVAHCPERVLPGSILHELKNNDRVIGVSNDQAGEIARSLYSSIVTGGNIYITDTITAEMCKLVENTYRDINIAFANELSMICDELRIDVWELIQLANKHPRVHILNPGAGVGGHCIAVDPWFIAERFPEQAQLIRTARHVNDFKPEWAAARIDKDIKERFGNKKVTIGILGLAYKANVGDLRESPSLAIARALESMGYTVIASEPNSDENLINGLANMSPEELVEEANYIVYTVAHNLFKDDLKAAVREKPFMDLAGEMR